MLAALAVLTLASTALQAEPPGPSGGRLDPLLPDTVFLAAGGPRIVLLGAQAGGVAALRLHVPLREGPAEAGVGRVLRDLALERMQGLAGPVGARVSATRTPWGLAYAVEGAAADLEYLAYLLRQAVAEPDVTGVGLVEARQRLERETARGREAPGPRLAAELRRAVAPHLPPPAGTSATVAGMDAARVREAWLRSYRSEAMTLVVAAAVAPEVLLAATRGMGAPADASTLPLDAPAPPESQGPRAQSLRTWYGEARSAGRPDEPLGRIAAILVAESLAERTAGFEAGVQLWELADRWALAVVGAAYRPEVRAMRAAVGSAVTETRAALTPERVARATARVRSELLLRSRTPGGLVELVGRAAEIDGDPLAATRYVRALEELGPDDVDAFLATLEQTSPVRAEVRP